MKLINDTLLREGDVVQGKGKVGYGGYILWEHPYRILVPALREGDFVRLYDNANGVPEGVVRGIKDDSVWVELLAWRDIGGKTGSFRTVQRNEVVRLVEEPEKFFDEVAVKVDLDEDNDPD